MVLFSVGLSFRMVCPVQVIRETDDKLSSLNRIFSEKKLYFNSSFSALESCMCRIIPDPNPKFSLLTQNLTRTNKVILIDQ